MPLPHDEDDFDDRIREHHPEGPRLPSDFQDRVWRSIRTQEEDAKSTGWVGSALHNGASPFRLAASFGVAAILISSLLGIWLGNATLTEQRTANLFPTLTAGPELLGP